MNIIDVSGRHCVIVDDIVDRAEHYVMPPKR